MRLAQPFGGMHHAPSRQVQPDLRRGLRPRPLRGRVHLLRHAAAQRAGAGALQRAAHDGYRARDASVHPDERVARDPRHDGAAARRRAAHLRGRRVPGPVRQARAHREANLPPAGDPGVRRGRALHRAAKELSGLLLQGGRAKPDQSSQSRAGLGRRRDQVLQEPPRREEVRRRARNPARAIAVPRASDAPAFQGVLRVPLDARRRPR